MGTYLKLLIRKRRRTAINYFLLGRDYSETIVPNILLYILYYIYGIAAGTHTQNVNIL